MPVNNNRSCNPHVFNNLPEAPPGAVLGDDADAARLDARPHERVDVFVSQVPQHLQYQCNDKLGQWGHPQIKIGSPLDICRLLSHASQATLYMINESSFVKLGLLADDINKLIDHTSISPSINTNINKACP